LRHQEACGAAWNVGTRFGNLLNGVLIGGEGNAIAEVGWLEVALGLRGSKVAETLSQMMASLVEELGVILHLRLQGVVLG